MPRVTTVEEVLHAARARAALKPNPLTSNALGLPTLAIAPGASAPVVWEFVPPTWPEPLFETWALVEDPTVMKEIDRKHREANAEILPGRQTPPLSTYSQETPFLIVRTV